MFVHVVKIPCVWMGSRSKYKLLVTNYPGKIPDGMKIVAVFNIKHVSLEDLHAAFEEHLKMFSDYNANIQTYLEDIIHIDSDSGDGNITFEDITEEAAYSYHAKSQIQVLHVIGKHLQTVY
jgi:hypothetical protein